MKTSLPLSILPLSILIILWSYAGLEKLIRFEDSRNAFRNQTFPPDMADALAIWVPVAELALAVILVIPALRWWGFLGSIMLLSVFNTYIGLIWVGAFPRVPCNCAGLLDSLDWSNHFWLNWVFMGLGIMGVYFNAPNAREKYKISQ